MIKIKNLESQHEEVLELRKKNQELYDKLRLSLLALMEKYKMIAEWYVDNGYAHYIIRDSAIYLSEDDDYIYYWNPKDTQVNIRRVSRIGNKSGFYSPYQFVKKGHFKNAEENILAMNSALEQIIKELRKENNKLKQLTSS